MSEKEKGNTRKKKKKRRQSEQRLNQLHPKEISICILICSEAQQMPAAFVRLFLGGFLVDNCVGNIKFA